MSTATKKKIKSLKGNRAGTKEYQRGYGRALKDAAQLLEEGDKQTQNLAVSEVVFFERKDGGNFDANGNKITTDMLMEYRHRIDGDEGFLILNLAYKQEES